MQKWMPLPNGEVAPGAGAHRVEAVGLVEHRGIVAGRGEPEEERRALGDVDAAELGRPLRPPPPERHGRVVAQRLFDDAGDERGVRDDGVPALGRLEEPADHVADEVVRRLVADEAQREQNRGDLLLRERLGIPSWIASSALVRSSARSVALAATRARR
jgi:hypothetical protein